MLCGPGVKLKKFIKCPAGQIVKYKLNNNNKKNLALEKDVLIFIKWLLGFLKLYLP